MPQIALLVYDERSLRAFVSEVLGREGFEVIEAKDGEDALAIIQSMHGVMDLLITDIRLPGMTGIELVNVVRTDYPWMPVVYISGELLCAGLHNPPARIVFLKKPFGPEAMLAAVHTVMAAVRVANRV